MTKSVMFILDTITGQKEEIKYGATIQEAKKLAEEFKQYPYEKITERMEGSALVFSTPSDFEVVFIAESK